MEVINKNHEEITKNKKVLNKAAIGFLNDRIITLSAGAARAFGLSDGLHMHIINDEEKWLVYFNDDPDGFKIEQVPNRTNFKVFNRSLVHLFLKRTKNIAPCKFLLKETQRKHSGYGLIEIITTNRIF